MRKFWIAKNIAKKHQKKFFTQMLLNHVRKSKRKWIMDKLGANNSKSTWKVVKTLTSKTTKPNVRPVYTINEKHMSQAETAETLNQYFIDIAGYPSALNLEFSLSHLPQQELVVSLGQVKQWLRNIDTSKSTCASDFPSWVSKLCCEDLCVPLCDIINHCLRTGTYPAIWKQADVIPFEKTKNISNPSDFRPISLLWNLGKVLERAIVFFYKSSVIPTIRSDQYAYQKGKSTTDAILSAVNLWTEMLDKKGCHSIPAAFLDMSKAFDRMDKSKVIEMLAARGVNRKLIAITHSFLNERTQRVKLGRSQSQTIQTMNGTPQGTLLGPLFWLLYIDTLSSTNVTLIKYADDLTITPNDTSNAKDSLQNAIDEITKWCEDHNMLANPKKSMTVHFSNIHNRHTPPTTNLTMKGEIVEDVTTMKFLGVMIDNHLTFKSHVDQIAQKTRPLIYTLLDLKRSGIPTSTMLQFYISCIRPIILYACPSWFSMLSKEQQQRLERIENLALKIIDPASTDYADRTSRHKITPIIDLLDTTSRQYIQKIANRTDHCLHNLVKRYAPKTAERQSKRLNLNRKPNTRTVLRSKCSIIHYW